MVTSLRNTSRLMAMSLLRPVAPIRCMATIQKALDPFRARLLIHTHLEQVIQVMNRKHILKERADFRDPRWEGAAAEFPWLPGYMIKLDPMERIHGGRLLSDGIRRWSLNLITLPEQTLYPIPETHH